VYFKVPSALFPGGTEETATDFGIGRSAVDIETSYVTNSRDFYVHGNYVQFEVIMAAGMKITVFWDIIWRVLEKHAACFSVPYLP
jgi:hypothetical protein